jgi:iron complex outermembrane receptor protein
MKSIVRQLFAAAVLLMASAPLLFGQGALSGRIVDQASRQPMAGVSVYLPDLKVGTTTNADGAFTLRRIPARRVMLQASFVGFRNLICEVGVGTDSVVVLALEPAATEINEVVVTGNAKAIEQKRSPAPISVVPRQLLVEAASSNIIDALAAQPGVAQITTGAGISKPVIRGLGYNRVLVVSDGIRQEGQQWGDEHGVEVDAYGVDRVEILKGPASLAYGSDAMAGVINLISAPLPTNGAIRGSILSEYQTNNGLAGLSANAAGSAGSLVWDARLSGKQAHSYRNRYDGYVFNSGFRENNASLLLGLKRDWGFANLTLGRYELEPGMVEGERDAATGRFVRQVNRNGAAEEVLATDADGHSYHPFTPSQKIEHYRAVLNAYARVGEGGLRAIVGFQQNQRKELGDVLAPSTPELYFKLNTVSYDLQYQLPERWGASGSVGVNGMGQTSRNLGEEVLVPEYNLFDAGIFGIIRKNLGGVDLTGGLRFDRRSISSRSLYLDADGEATPQPMPDGSVRFRRFSSAFSGISGSVGATWQLSRYAFLKANVSRGYRAPNIAELGSNGVHEGTLRYELGDPNLRPEHSLQADLGAGYCSEHISAEVSLFSSWISRYIYLHKLSSRAGADSTIDGVDAFRFDQGDAHLTGGEARLDIHPHPFDWIHLENSFSYVLATLRHQPAEASHLPFTPPAKLMSGVKLEGHRLSRGLANSYVRFDVETYFRQGEVYSAYGTETATPGYVLLNAGVGSDWVVRGRTVCTIVLSATNLADRAYQSHLSRLKYAPENPVTGRSGIYNMGRSFGFKLLIPFEGSLGRR